MPLGNFNTPRVTLLPQRSDSAFTHPPPLHLKVTFPRTPQPASATKI